MYKFPSSRGGGKNSFRIFDGVVIEWLSNQEIKTLYKVLSKI